MRGPCGLLNLLPSLQCRSVDLREAGGGEWRIVERGEELLHWLPQLLGDELLGTFGGKARNLVLQPRELADHLRLQYVDAR